MGFWNEILKPAWRYFTPNVQYLHTVEEVVDELFQDGSFSVANLWKNQHHLQTVVGFLARNVAHVGLHLYERVGDDDPRRDRKSIGAQLLRRPNDQMSMFNMLFALEADKKLYDRAYWWVRPTDTEIGMEIRRIPPAWVAPKHKNAYEMKSYEVKNEKNESIEIPADEILDFTGYNPSDPLRGSSAVVALRHIMAEQIQAQLYRRQVWKNGARSSAVIERPANARWSKDARDAFREDWYTKWTGNGDRAGGTPILEDGMTLRRIDFSAQESQFMEVAKLSMATIASTFHVQPSMIGILDQANFAVVKEFRLMLYTETLGPDFEEIQQRLNGWLLPMIGLDPERFYFEFNIQRKLQGSFEDQASLLSTSIGRPWMTANEGRKRWNLPRIEGGDELVTPLNVLVGGQASPQSPSTGSEGTADQLIEEDDDEEGEEGRSAGPQAPPDRWGILPNSERHIKGGGSLTGGLKALEGYGAKYAEIMQGYFRRQRAAVESRFKAGVDWWDDERWNRELGHDLTAWNLMTCEEAAKALLDAVGVESDAFNLEQAEAWLSKVGRNSAANINAQTRDRLKEALEEENPDILDVVFGDERSKMLAVGALTTIAAFSRQEAGKQAGASSKTWITGQNPRDTHAAMNGQTVPIRDNFSNGMAWPGDPSGGVDDLAGCNCELQVNWEDSE